MGRKRKQPTDGEEAAPAAAPAPVAGEAEFNPIAQYYQSWALGKVTAAVEANQGTPMDPDVQDLCDQFHIEERHAKKLNEQMQLRVETFEADMLRLWTDLERAHNPNGLLVVQMRQMGDGTFVGKNKPDPEFTEIVNRFKLDAQAEEKLLDTISRHQYDKRKEYYGDLNLHLSASNKASATAMMLLRKVGEGEPLGPAPRGKGGGKDQGKDQGKGDSNRDSNRDGDRDRDRRGDNRDGDRDRDRGSDRDRRDGGRDWDRDQGSRGSDNRDRDRRDGDRGYDDRSRDRDRRDEWKASDTGGGYGGSSGGGGGGWKEGGW